MGHGEPTLRTSSTLRPHHGLQLGTQHHQSPAWDRVRSASLSKHYTLYTVERMLVLKPGGCGVRSRTHHLMAIGGSEFFFGLPAGGKIFLIFLWRLLSPLPVQVVQERMTSLLTQGGGHMTQCGPIRTLHSPPPPPPGIRSVTRNRAYPSRETQFWTRLGLLIDMLFQLGLSMRQALSKAWSKQGP